MSCGDVGMWDVATYIFYSWIHNNFIDSPSLLLNSEQTLFTR